MEKAKVGDKILLTKDICYGSVYGLVKLGKGAILTVANRNSSDDGVKTVETITQKNVVGTRTTSYTVWDKEYEIQS